MTIPITLSKQQIEEFQKLWFQSHQENLTEIKAKEKAEYLISLISTFLIVKYQI